MTELATATYRIDFASHNAFVLAWLRRNVFSRRNLGRFLVFAGLAAVLCFVQMKGLAGPARQVLAAGAAILSGLIIGAAMVYVLAPVTIWLWQMLSFGFGGLRLRDQAVRLTGSGVEKTVGADSHVTGWDGIHEVVDTRRALLLFTGRNSAMVIPKSAFATPEAATVFADAVTERSLRRPHPAPEKNF